jgi:hypothetical protein
MNRIQRLMASVATALLATGHAASASIEQSHASVESIWAKIVETDTLEAYAAFVMRYPDSTFAALAYRRLSGTGAEASSVNFNPPAPLLPVEAADEDDASTPDFVPGWIRLI